MRAAQVNADGLVVNLIEVEPDELTGLAGAFAPDQLIECPDNVGPGWIYDGTDWAPPPLPDDFYPPDFVPEEPTG